MVDPLASQRAELLGKLAVAQFDLENALAELSRSTASTGPLETQLQNLTALMRQVGAAGPGALAGLRGDIASVVAQSNAVAQHARSGSAATHASEMLEARMDRLQASMDAMNSDLFEKRVLDPYLRFENADEESAYRRREQERIEEINRLRAIGTPEALRQAAQLQLDQVVDAGDHGAKDSPDYPRLLGTAQANLGEIEAIEAAKESRNGAVSTEAAPPKSTSASPVIVSSEMDEIGAALAAAGVSVGSATSTVAPSVPDARTASGPAAGLS